MKSYTITGKGKNWKVLDEKGNEVSKPKSKKDAEAIVLSLSTPLGSTPETPPEEAPREEKKVTCNIFAGTYLINHPDANEEELRKALTEAGIRLNQSVIEAWLEDWPWMLPAFDAAGWQRPKAN